RKETLLSLLFVLSTAAVGCADMSVDAGSRSPIYGLGFCNVTDAPMKEVSAEWTVAGDTHGETVGVLGSRMTKIVRGGPRPIPKEFVVKWQTADGATHSQKVERPAIKPDEEHFSGDVWFRISGDGASIVPLTGDEEVRRGWGRRDFLK
ncbi:MAG TPA: hypothetical protein VH370_08775, partial [Humisphaera sp.]|nr:hypothetical protein [Humisphaera sp.]